MAGRLLVAAWLALLLAGCLHASPGQHQASASSTSSARTPEPSTSTAPSPNPTVSFQGNLSLTDCQGIRVRFVWPANLAPTGDEVPPGWEAGGGTTSNYHVMLAHCGRVAVGPFERGPIDFLLEIHDRVNPPDPCLNYNGDTYSALVMHSIWFNDQEVADYAKTQLAMPAHFGAFTFNSTDAPDFSVFKWTWQEPNGPISELTYSRADGPTGHSTPVDRVFWRDGKAASFMDWQMDDTQPLANSDTAVGWLRSPMLYAQSGNEFYSSSLATLIDPGGAYTGTIHRFGDLQCKQPLP